MKLVERPRSHPEDPTERWPAGVAVAPHFDWSDLRLGPICFGEPIECAEPLGRPDSFRWTRPGCCELVYARAGFRIDFDDERFARIAYFIGPDHDAETHPQMTYSTPDLDDELALTRDVLVADIKEKLGPATAEKTRGTATVLVYAGGGVVLEFEFDADGRLRRWNLFPQEEDA